jgi:hypothetical protein
MAAIATSPSPRRLALEREASRERSGCDRPAEVFRSRPETERHGSTTIGECRTPPRHQVEWPHCAHRDLEGSSAWPPSVKATWLDMAVSSAPSSSSRIESYRYWQERLKRTGLVHGQFGENLPSKDCTAAPMFVTAGRTRAIRSVKISMPPATYRDQSFAKSASQEKLMSTSAGRLASWQMKEALATLGVAPERIHIEIFNGSESMTPGVVGTATRAPHLPKGDANFGPVSFARSGIAAHWKRMPPTMLPKNGKERLFTWAEVSRRSAGRNSRHYEDKLNGAISEEFWRELHIRWTEEESILANRWSRLMQPISQEQQLTMKRILELANSTPALDQTQNLDQQAQLLKMIVSNCRTDGVNHWPVYRKPFNPIFERAKTEEWCAREDSNF